MKKTYDIIMRDIERTKEPDENTRQLVFTLSKIIDEERMLQDIVDREGVTYQTTGDKGQTYIKSRPEYVELQRLRDKKRAYIAAIGITEGEAINPDFA
jgi:ubiquinone biosynthesis protein Coq4